MENESIFFLYCVMKKKMIKQNYKKQKRTLDSMGEGFSIKLSCCCSQPDETLQDVKKAVQLKLTDDDISHELKQFDLVFRRDANLGDPISSELGG
jgi:hypothetical protein